MITAVVWVVQGAKTNSASEGLPGRTLLSLGPQLASDWGPQGIRWQPQATWRHGNHCPGRHVPACMRSGPSGYLFKVFDVLVLVLLQQVLCGKWQRLAAVHQGLLPSTQYCCCHIHEEFNDAMVVVAEQQIPKIFVLMELLLFIGTPLLS